MRMRMGRPVALAGAPAARAPAGPASSPASAPAPIKAEALRKSRLDMNPSFRETRSSEAHLEDAAVRAHEPPGIGAREGDGPVVGDARQEEPGVAFVRGPRGAAWSGRRHQRSSPSVV